MSLNVSVCFISFSSRLVLSNICSHKSHLQMLPTREPTKIVPIHAFCFISRETKIVLKGDNITILEDLRRKSEAAGLPCYLVSDAGRTQVGPFDFKALSRLHLRFSSSCSEITWSLFASMSQQMSNILRKPGGYQRHQHLT